jgi:hypothetical protein
MITEISRATRTRNFRHKKYFRDHGGGVCPFCDPGGLFRW